MFTGAVNRIMSYLPDNVADTVGLVLGTTAAAAATWWLFAGGPQPLKYHVPLSQQTVEIQGQVGILNQNENLGSS